MNAVPVSLISAYIFAILSIICFDISVFCRLELGLTVSWDTRLCLCQEENARGAVRSEFLMELCVFLLKHHIGGRRIL